MKSHFSKFALLSVIVLGVVAWSHPNSEDVILGTTNVVTSPSGFLTVVGEGNKVNAKNSLIVGSNNRVAHTGTSTLATCAQSIIAGDGNVVDGGRFRNLVSGNSNSVNSQNALVVGTSNTVKRPNPEESGYECAAIGVGNLVSGVRGWTMGDNNSVSGNYSVAFGSWNNVTTQYSYALGGGLIVDQGVQGSVRFFV